MPQSNNQKIILDDAYLLTYGKRSHKRVGSRSISHRLNKFERSQFELARQDGLLFSMHAINPALINSYFNLCCAMQRDFLVLHPNLEATNHILLYYRNPNIHSNQNYLRGAIDELFEYYKISFVTLEQNINTSIARKIYKAIRDHR
jgi:hypothetical protein